MANLPMIIFFFFCVIAVFLIGVWFSTTKAHRKIMVDEPAKTVDEILNEKVPREKGHVIVNFGGDLIQLSPQEFLIWNTWDRKRKRIFVREFRKVETKPHVTNGS